MKSMFTRYGPSVAVIAMLIFTAFLTSTPVMAQVSSFPYSEGFDSGAGNHGPWGAWTQGPRSSNPQWEEDNNSTGSSNTGPSGPQSGSDYVYLECSGGSLGDTDYITASFDFTSLTVPEMSFYYHMYGSDMGTLALEVSPDNGSSWLQVWSKSGQQHSSETAAWTQATVSLCPFAGLSTVMIRFAGTRGDGFGSDMAVDNVSISNGTANPATYSSSTATQGNTLDVSAGQNNEEILGVEITSTGVCPQTAVTSFTFNTNGTTNTGDIDNARLWYTGPSNSFATAIQFGSAVANPSGSFTFTDNLGVSGGTVYFWMTYDIDPNASAGNQVDAQFTSVTVGGTSRTPTTTNPSGSRTIVTPMSGTYTIDANGSGNRNFTTFNEAVTQLGIAGVSGAVTFNVAAGTYNEEVTIPEVLGASATNTITFDGIDASTRTLTNSTSSSYDFVLRLDGADYIVIKNLTITANGSTYGFGVHLTNEADHNEISDCVINVPNSSSSYAIGILASSPTSYSSSGDWAEHNLIKDNTISGGYYGIRFNGQSSSGDQAEYNKFYGNVVKDWYYYGMYLYYQRYLEVIDNEVTVRSSGTSSSYGLRIYYPQGGPKVIGNKVVAGYYPLYFYRPNYYGPTGYPAKVINNMFVSTRTSGTAYGARIYYAEDTDVWFNSFTTRSSSDSYGVYLYGSSGADVDFRNNWIADLDASSGDSRLFYNNNDGLFSAFDHNAFYSLSTGSDMFYYDGSYYSSFTALPTSVHNTNSVWGNPYFYAEDDLHSNSHVGYQAGVSIASVTDDYDGDTRQNPPCIGADEYPAPPPEFDVAVQAVLIDYAEDKWVRKEGTAEHTVKIVLENTGLSANPASVDVGYASAPMSQPGDADVLETVSPNWNGRHAVVEFSTPLTGLTAPSTVTVYARVFWGSDLEPANDESSDTQDIFDEKYHGYEDFNGYDTPFFSYLDGWLDMPWTIVDNNGGEEIVTAPGVGVNGTTAAYFEDSGEPADEWIISPAASLLPAASYRTNFTFENFSNEPVSIEVAWSSSPTPGSMTTFATFSSVGQGTHTAKDLWINSGEAGDPYFNTPPTAGVYYLGIHVTSSNPGTEWSIDNIKLDDNPSPPPKIGYALPGSPIEDFVDDDSDPIQVTANYKQPGLINKTFQVATTTNIYGFRGDMLWDVESADPWISITKETPEPTEQGYNFTPPRPRQFQTFTMTVDPSGMAPGLHVGHLTFYAVLFNDDFPPPNQGLVATNQPLEVEVHLRITNTGGGTGRTTLVGKLPGPFTVPGSPYHFVDTQTGDPIATLEVTAGQIDELTIRTYPNQLPQNLSRLLYVKRYWQFDHVGSGWTANVTFPYADHEASMVMDRNQLRGVRQPSPLGMWEDPINGTTSVSDPLHNAVSVNGLNEFNITGNIALAQPYGIFMRDGDAGVPDAYALRQNYPNPFNPATSISYALPAESHVRLAVYNALGAEVAVLVDETQAAGRYEARFDATDLPSGLYIYRMTAGDFTQTRTMTLSK